MKDFIFVFRYYSVRREMQSSKSCRWHDSESESCQYPGQFISTNIILCLLIILRYFININNY